MKRMFAGTVAVLVLWGSATSSRGQLPPDVDPLAASLKGRLQPTVEVLLAHCRTQRKYQKLPAALAPLPMLAGLGRQDTGSHREHAASFRAICESQYAALNTADNYSYLIHDGGDTMPSEQVIAWFKRQFHIGP